MPSEIDALTTRVPKHIHLSRGWLLLRPMPSSRIAEAGAPFQQASRRPSCRVGRRSSSKPLGAASAAYTVRVAGCVSRAFHPRQRMSRRCVLRCIGGADLGPPAEAATPQPHRWSVSPFSSFSFCPQAVWRRASGQASSWPCSARPAVLAGAAYPSHWIRRPQLTTHTRLYQPSIPSPSADVASLRPALHQRGRPWSAGCKSRPQN